MRCPSCDRDNRAERRFWAVCDTPLAALCASCDATNELGEKFGGGCGTALTAGRPAGSTAPSAVIVGTIGDDLHMDHTAQGHTIGLALRMESLAEPNTCFLTVATAAL
jgi:hypothetical protein